MGGINEYDTISRTAMSIGFSLPRLTIDVFLVIIAQTFVQI